ncbi:MAG TPA: SDR family NAD(P)-dependent oxidoreductase, partial [Gemmatimonadaceae bacterium]
MIDLTGKRALVTGGSRGIGAATALLLAQAGADVCIGYRKRKEAANAVVRRIQALGRRASAVAGDLAQRADCDHLIQSATQDMGGLDIFVGNAGTWPSEPVAVDA